jgi:hypothetical protein
MRTSKGIQHVESLASFISFEFSFAFEDWVGWTSIVISGKLINRPDLTRNNSQSVKLKHLYLSVFVACACETVCREFLGFWSFSWSERVSFQKPTVDTTNWMQLHVFWHDRVLGQLTRGFKESVCFCHLRKRQKFWSFVDSDASAQMRHLAQDRGPWRFNRPKWTGQKAPNLVKRLFPAKRGLALQKVSTDFSLESKKVRTERS